MCALFSLTTAAAGGSIFEDRAYLQHREECLQGLDERVFLKPHLGLNEAPRLELLVPKTVFTRFSSSNRSRIRAKSEFGV